VLAPACLTACELDARVQRLTTTLGERLTHLDREVLREVMKRAGEREGVVEALLDRTLQWGPQLERNRLLEEVAEAALALRRGEREAGRHLQGVLDGLARHCSANRNSSGGGKVSWGRRTPLPPSLSRSYLLKERGNAGAARGPRQPRPGSPEGSAPQAARGYFAETADAAVSKVPSRLEGSASDCTAARAYPAGQACAPPVDRPAKRRQA
jgi:hypothetical protein